ncbi:MAG: DUF4388 domain-containing protein [Myxococcales bacterium]|nr:DUF4388 domain-containing protein [Myxococcales bacterium]
MQRSRPTRGPRVVARCRVEFERLDRRVVAESEDLSRRGVFVRTDELLPAGAVTELDLTLPDGVTFRVFARVAHLLAPSAARALGRHVGMGFEFLEVEGGADVLARYLDDLIEELTPPPTPVADVLHLVLAEPSAPLRARMATALTAAGFIIEEFGDGAAAYAACAERCPDGVLTAAAMAGLDGPSLIRSLALHPRLAHVPVVMVSDDASDLTRLEAFRLGVRDYITRPFLDEELVIRVRRATALAPRGLAESAMVRGDLSEISVATLLALFEFERKSGVLVVVDAARAARLFVAAGRVVKVEANPADDAPRLRLMAVLDWTRGHFEFTGCEVVGADEIGLPTTQLLLEHARVRDESARPPSQ